MAQTIGYRICGKLLKCGFKEKRCLSHLGVQGIVNILAYFSNSALRNPQKKINDGYSQWLMIFGTA